MEAYRGLTDDESKALRTLHRMQWTHDVVPSPDVAACTWPDRWVNRNLRRTLTDDATRLLRRLATRGCITCAGAGRLDYTDVETMFPGGGEGDVTHFVWTIAPAGEQLIADARR